MRKLSRLFFVYLNIFFAASLSPLLAQSPAAQDAETTKAKETKQALELLRQATVDAHTLKLPENKAAQLAQAAEIFAHYDEKTARELVPEITENLQLLFSHIDENNNQNRYFYSRRVIRQEAINSIAKFDYELALAVLHKTGPDSNSESMRIELQQAEATLEQNLAAQLANNNPAAALKAAEQSLERGFSYELNNLLRTILKKASDKADQLLNKMYEKLQHTDLLANVQTLNAVTGFLHEELNAHKNELTAGEKMYGVTNRKPALSKEDLKKWIDAIVRSALTLPNRYDGLKDGINIIYLLENFRTKINFIAPEQAAQVNQVLAKIRPKLPPNAQERLEINQFSQAGKMEELLAFIERAPKERKDELLWNAVHAAIDYYADPDLANKIIDERVISSDKKKEYRSFVSWIAAQVNAEQGKVDEALNSLNSIASNFDKARTLTLIAQRNIKKKEIKLQLLEQALQVLGNDLDTAEAADTFNQIVLAYAEIDAERGFALFEPRVQALDVIWKSGAIYCSFDVNTPSCRARKNELIIAKNWSMGALNSFIAVFTALGKTNFARAAALTEQIQSAEVRLAAKLNMLRGCLVTEEE